MHLNSSSACVAAFCIIGIALGGCASAKYSALEKVGIHKRDILVDNVEDARDILDTGMYHMIKQGWTEITIGETTSFRLNESYVQATRDHAGSVSLGDKPGVIDGYVAGRPFPQEPDRNDPRAGEKLAWNYRHSVHFGDSGMISPFYWKYRDMNTGKVERQLKFEFRAMNRKHRTTNAPTPGYEVNPSGVFRTIYMGVHEPFDVKNTQLLIHRFEDDLKRDSAWLYLGFQRRVRRLARPPMHFSDPT